MFGRLTDVLPRCYPTVFEQCDEGVHNRFTGETWNPDADPLTAAALLVQEELCLLELREGTPYLDAGTLCFSPGWRPTEARPPLKQRRSKRQPSCGQIRPSRGGMGVSSRAGGAVRCVRRAILFYRASLHRRAHAVLARCNEPETTPPNDSTPLATAPDGSTAALLTDGARDGSRSCPNCRTLGIYRLTVSPDHHGRRARLDRKAAPRAAHQYLIHRTAMIAATVTIQPPSRCLR